MEVDFSVELGPDNEILEFPWTDPDNLLRYFDLKHTPELLREIEEATRFPELGEFLAAINLPGGKLESAKCDAWFTNEILPEDEIFGAAGKFASYVDLIFRAPDLRNSFPQHEAFATQLTKLLKRAPEISAMAEFIIRRCFFGTTSEGFYFTFYLFGYGCDQGQSRQRWAVAMKLVENALRQLSAGFDSGVQSR